jgi:hypothetical protein
MVIKGFQPNGDLEPDNDMAITIDDGNFSLVYYVNNRGVKEKATTAQA